MKVLGEVNNINIFNSSELLGAVDCFTIDVIESGKLPNSPNNYLDELLAILDEEEEVHVKEAPKDIDELRSQKMELIGKSQICSVGSNSQDDLVESSGYDLQVGTVRNNSQSQLTVLSGTTSAPWIFMLKLQFPLGNICDFSL
ncbi:hypothetical protein LWI29_002348 [Acer saccharum]|uniref:Uncharacterized protein n=1 Tax=Acer saccharum TaxID=4024 RepID=A0AA39VQ08_ACESA|nr:hypothetical protein LWI29_002348 [Acer saccharum]